MKKLKCWKKVGKHLFVNKKQKVYVFPYAVDINDKWKDFNKKSQAMKFANKYMLKHNVC